MWGAGGQGECQGPVSQHRCTVRIPVITSLRTTSHSLLLDSDFLVNLFSQNLRICILNYFLTLDCAHQISHNLLFAALSAFRLIPRYLGKKHFVFLVVGVGVCVCICACVCVYVCACVCACVCVYLGISIFRAIPEHSFTQMNIGVPAMPRHCSRCKEPAVNQIV